MRDIVERSNERPARQWFAIIAVAIVCRRRLPASPPPGIHFAGAD